MSDRVHDLDSKHGMCGHLEERWGKFMLDDNRHWAINFALNYFDKMIPESIWVKDFRSIPSFPMYVMALWFNLTWWGVLVYFVTRNYLSGVNDTFISLDMGSGHCTPVPFVLDGNYFADQSGVWETEKKYDDSTAIFSSSYLGFEATNQSYMELFQSDIGARFAYLGQKMKKRDLAYNLIAWSSYSFNQRIYSGSVDAQGNKEYLFDGKFSFGPSGEISVILNKAFIYGAIVEFKTQLPTYDVCLNRYSSVINYDVTAGTITFGFDYDSIGATCKRIARKLVMDFNRGSQFEKTINLNSFSTAVAVNYNIISVKSMVPTEVYRDGIFDDDYYIYDDYDDYVLGDDYFADDDADTVDDSVDDDGYDDDGYDDDAGSVDDDGYDDDAGSVDDDGGGYDDDTSPFASAAEANIVRKNVATMQARRKQLKKTSTKGNARRAFQRLESRGSMASATDQLNTWVKYYDPRYLNMDPIYCVSFSDSSNISSCFLLLATDSSNGRQVFAYPIIKQWQGTNCSDWPENWYTDPSLQDMYFDLYDHTIDMLLGMVVFFNEEDALEYARESYELRLNDPENGDKILADTLHSAMVASLGYTGTFDRDAVCGVGRKCLLITLNPYGPDYYINSHNYQLVVGACRDSLYNATTLTSLGTAPPQLLMQIYFTCRLRPYNAFYQALGLALGNADAYTKVAFYFYMIVFLAILRYQRGFDNGMTVFISEQQRVRDEQLAEGMHDEKGGYVNSEEIVIGAVTNNQPIKDDNSKTTDQPASYEYDIEAGNNNNDGCIPSTDPINATSNDCVAAATEENSKQHDKNAEDIASDGIELKEVLSPSFQETFDDDRHHAKS